MKRYLETERLVLRELVDSDADHLLALDGDPEVMRYIGPFALPDRDAYRQRIRAYQETYARGPGHGLWAAVDRDTAAFLGWFHLRPALDYRFAAEAGYAAGDLDVGYRFRREAWGRGLATEGAQALVKKAFADLAAPRVVACALATNRASLRVLEKAGLRRHHAFGLPGFPDPAVMYALTADEYRDDTRQE